MQGTVGIGASPNCRIPLWAEPEFGGVLPSSRSCRRAVSSGGVVRLPVAQVRQWRDGVDVAFSSAAAGCRAGGNVPPSAIAVKSSTAGDGDSGIPGQLERSPTAMTCDDGGECWAG